MSTERSELRRVKTFSGAIGYFHCWTNVEETPEYAPSFPVKQAIIELRDGTLVTFEPKFFSFIPETRVERLQAEAAEYFAKDGIADQN